MAVDNPGWPDRLGAPLPGYFAFVMATGIIAIGARQLDHPAPGWVLFGIGFAAYVLLRGCGAIRAGA